MAITRKSNFIGVHSLLHTVRLSLPPSLLRIAVSGEGYDRFIAMARVVIG